MAMTIVTFIDTLGTASFTQVLSRTLGPFALVCDLASFKTSPPRNVLQGTRNLVIYLPPAFRARDTEEVTPLARKEIWHGRVEPRHVERMMEDTIKGRRITQELSRGMHHLTQDG